MKNSDIQAVAEGLVEASIVNKLCLLTDKELFGCWRCKYYVYAEYDIPHKPDCPVPIAEKLLEEMKC